MAKMVTIEIEGKKIKAEKGSNLLKTAHQAGIDIPALCYHPRLSPSGACRLCVVKINVQEPLPACTMEVESGMKITAFDDELESRRTRLLDLLLCEHDCNCLYCDLAGSCQLQELAERYGLIGLNPERFRQVYQDASKKFSRFPTPGFLTSSPDGKLKPLLSVDNDYNGEPEDCIRCGFCLEACAMNIYPVLLMEAREQNNEKLLAELHPEDCINCGLCSYVCPSQIRIPKYFYEKKKENKIVK